MADLGSYHRVERQEDVAARGSRSAAPAPITLAPIVLIKGPEGLLVDRALDRLRALAYEADPNLERTDINAATYQAGQIDVIASPSLFGESRMVIIRDLETMSDALASDLIAYAAAPAPDVWMFLPRRQRSRQEGDRRDRQGEMARDPGRSAQK